MEATDAIGDSVYEASEVGKHRFTHARENISSLGTQNETRGARASCSINIPWNLAAHL